ncbi:MAG: 3-phosphoshikimate 1-carboxyvinyltransferase, partial [Chitinophagaceae bacterium]
AYSAANAAGISITVKNLKSAGYIGLTLDVMKKFGMQVPDYSDFSSFYFAGEVKKNTSKEIIYTIESDWSGTAFLLVAGAVAGHINISGLDLESQQPDKAIIEVLKSCGANILYKNDSLEISKSNLKSFHFDATDCPDLFPPLAALATCCEGISSIKGVHRLLHKESNRAHAIQQELKKMGIDMYVENDEMIIKGGSQIQQAIIETHGDHRIAMMCSIVALVANGETMIQHAEVVGKSFPDFFKILQSLGAVISNA